MKISILEVDGLSSRADRGIVEEVPPIRLETALVRVPGAPLRPLASASRLHASDEAFESASSTNGNSIDFLSRRRSHCGEFETGVRDFRPTDSISPSKSGISHQLPEILPLPIPKIQIYRSVVGFSSGNDQHRRRQASRDDIESIEDSRHQVSDLPNNSLFWVT